MLIAPETWITPCGVSYRWFTDGRIEVEGLGFPAWDVNGAQANVMRKIWADWGAPIQAAAAKYQIPAAWLVALMRQETGGNPNLGSSAGACGLMQFTGVARKMYGRDCAYYAANPADQIADAADLLLKNTTYWKGGILSGLKQYNGGSPCQQAKGVAVTKPGIVNMWGEGNYIEKFIYSCNTFVAMNLPAVAAPDQPGGTTPAAVQGIVVAGILGAVAYMFADLKWQLTDRIVTALGLDTWNR